jgi:hypothetical protein
MRLSAGASSGQRCWRTASTVQNSSISVSAEASARIAPRCRGYLVVNDGEAEDGAGFRRSEGITAGAVVGAVVEYDEFPTFGGDSFIEPFPLVGILFDITEFLDEIAMEGKEVRGSAG